VRSAQDDRERNPNQIPLIPSQITSSFLHNTFSSIICKNTPESFMHLVMRWMLVLAALTVPLHGGLQSEYKQADTNYYLSSDLFLADPSVCIVKPDDVTNMGGSYLLTTQPHAPQVVYLQQTHDWLEPITPPNMPASLNCPSEQMQVREPQGSVQVALPSAPASFQDVKSGMAIPNGSVLRTGDNSSVAVLFGGVDSVRLAPGTRAAVQMNITGGVRDVEVDTRGGMVFSKVGQRAGEREAYAVHTPYGIASAHGTDYVTVVLGHRVDVWVAQGTVELASPDGETQITVSTGNEPLKVMRFPLADSVAAANADSAQSLTALLNFIPMANQKLAALASRSQSGREPLTDKEKEYIGRIRHVTSLIKLATGNVPVTPLAIEPATTPADVVSKPARPALPVVETTSTPATKPVVPAPAKSVAVAPSKPTPAAKVAVSTAKTTVDPSTGYLIPGIQATPHDGPTVAGKPFVLANEDAGSTTPVIGTGAKPLSLTPTSEPELVKPIAGSPGQDITTLSTKPATTKTAQTAKPKHKPAPAVAANLAPPPESPYPRAKPVDATDLVTAPAVMGTPPPARAPVAAVAPIAPVSDESASSADPNSLGAQLSPFRSGATPPKPLAPRYSGASLDDVQSSVTSPLGGVTGKANESAP
jgi:hypothetical protein